MESHGAAIAAKVLDLKGLQVERDRAIALAFVRKGESKSAAREIIEETGVNRRTVYRAISRQLDWARHVHAEEQEAEGHQSADGHPP